MRRALFALTFQTFLVAYAVGHRGCPMHHATSAVFNTSKRYNDTIARILEPLGITYLLGVIDPSSVSMCTAPQCSENATYRSYDGSCSNVDLIQKPSVGSRHQCHRRLLAPSYVDGISKPAEWVDVATIFNVLQQRQPPEAIGTEGNSNGMFAMLSQFLAHDFTQTFIEELPDSVKNFDCCDATGRDLVQCSMRINVSQVTVYEEEGSRCMTFVRAARCPCTQGKIRESMNMQTAYLDLSHIYLSGSFRNPVKRWRLPSTEGTISGSLPPMNPKPKACYGPKCFQGDGRSSQHQGLSLYHVVFERLHNRMADRLEKLKPSWTHERVFEEARRLVIARWQYVVCKDFMEVLVDDKLRRQSNLHIDQLMLGTEVDDKAEAVTFVESVHSEFRGHGLVPNRIGGETFNWLNATVYLLKKNYPRVEALAQWSTPSKQAFPFSDAVAHETLKYPTDTLGLSMLLINIQRSRDTGVPTFKALTEWTYNMTISTFEDVAKLNVYTPSDLNLLRHIYGDDVSKVDMFVGGHLQLPYGTGIAPLVHQKIHLRQHYGQVYGDRFFFSHRNVFSRAQRRAIANSSSLAQILCETLELDEVPETPLRFKLMPVMLKCSNMKTFDYSTV